MTTTDSNNAPETYELPPEPPIGTRVVDKRGISWKRERRAAYGWDSLHMGGQCWSALLKDGPLTRIPDPEPNPWPTAPLIVATLDTDGPRTVYMRNGDAYESTDNWVQADTDIPLTNVIPVTVVPVAEMRHAREMLAAADAGDFDSFLGSFRALIAATDALGVDL